MNEGGERVRRQPPTDEQVQAFEAHFGVKLPKDYLSLLHHSNGGCPVLDSFVPKVADEDEGEEELWGINRFYYLNDDRTAVGGLWWMTTAWQAKVGPRIIPFAGDGGGDQIVLNFASDPPSVQVCLHEEEFELVDVADSFGEFIDMLHEDPDLLEDEAEDEE